MNFDAAQYEERQNRLAREAASQLRPLIELDQWGSGPTVEFLCPKQHSLKRYRAEEQHETLILAPLPGDAGHRGPVATNGSPWTKGKSPCLEPGCGALVPASRGGTCDAHGGRAEERVHEVRTRFACRCGWSDSFTLARLIKVYGFAVALGLDRVPVTLSAPTHR